MKPPPVDVVSARLGDEVGGFRWRYAAAGAVVTAPGGGADGKQKSSKKGKEAWLEFRDRLYDPSEPHIYKNGNRLRGYQVEGVNWLQLDLSMRQTRRLIGRCISQLFQRDFL